MAIPSEKMANLSCPKHLFANQRLSQNVQALFLQKSSKIREASRKQKSLKTVEKVGALQGVERSI